MQHEHVCCPHALLWAIGALIGIGQLLLGDSELTLRKAVGRALVSGGIAESAGAALAFGALLNPFRNLHV